MDKEVYFLLKDRTTKEPMELIMIRNPKRNKEELQKLINEISEVAERDLPDYDITSKIDFLIGALKISGESAHLMWWSNDDVLYF